MTDNPYLVVRVHKSTGAEDANFSDTDKEKLLDQIEANKRTMEDYVQVSDKIQQQLREVPKVFEMERQMREMEHQMRTVMDQMQNKMRNIVKGYKSQASKTLKDVQNERDNNKNLKEKLAQTENALKLAQGKSPEHFSHKLKPVQDRSIRPKRGGGSKKETGAGGSEESSGEREGGGPAEGGGGGGPAEGGGGEGEKEGGRGAVGEGAVGE